jgi:hypothetical protein
MLERYARRIGLDEANLEQAKVAGGPYLLRKASVKAKLIEFGGGWATKFPEELAWKWRKSDTLVGPRPARDGDEETGNP